MKTCKITFLFIALFLFCMNTLPAQIENSDRPKNGNWDFKLKEEWVVIEAEDDLFFQITQMKVPYEGPVYLYDYKRAKFFVFDPSSGRLLKSFGKEGQGPGEFNMVLDFFVTPEHFIVYDFGKLHFISPENNYSYLESKVLDNTTGTPPSLFLDKNRFLTVPRNPENPDMPKRIDIYNMRDGDATSIAGTPLAEVSNKSSAKQRVVTSLGGGGAGSFKNTEYFIMTLKDGILYYGLNDLYIIKALDLDGNELMSFSLNNRKRTKTSKEFRKKREDGLRKRNHNFPSAVLQQMIDSIPQEATYFYKLHVDEQGMIYVFVSDIEDSNTEFIDIFSPKGEYVYRSEINAPDNFSFHSSGIHFFKNSLFCVVENEDGEVHLKKYKIIPPPSK